MNNDTGNNFNGTVLGNLDNTTPTNDIPIDNAIETLEDSPVTPSINQSTPNNTLDNGVTQPENNILEPTNQPSQVVEPTPAYTNPQAIQEMPSFDNPNIIGTTPPISFQEEKPQQQKNNKNNKTLFIIIILAVLAGVGFGTYYILTYTDFISKAAQVTIKPKNMELSLGDSLSTIITDYAEINGTDAKNCSLNTVDVDISKEGTYEYSITCGETIKKGKITIVDNKEFTYETVEVSKSKGATIDAKEFIVNAPETAKIEFVDKEKVNLILAGNPGTYSVVIKVTNNGKTTEVEGKLTILEYELKGYITCSSNAQNVADSSAKMVVSEKMAIANDGNNGYGKKTYEIHKFTFTDETEYTGYLAKYKSENKLTINNITGETKFDDATLTITITNEKNNEAVNSEFGADNMINYQTINKYFRETLGYQCVYEKIDTGA